MNFLADPKLLIILELLVAVFPIFYKGIVKILADKLTDAFRKLGRGAQTIFLLLRSFALLVYISLVFLVLSTMSWVLANIAFLEGNTEWSEQIGLSWLFSSIGDSLMVVMVALTLGFLVLCDFWRRFLYCFPIFMSGVSWLVTRAWDPRKFPKIIDYGYYFVAAIVLFNLIAAAKPGLEIDTGVIKIEVMVALTFLSLKFTKVNLELFSDHYFGTPYKVRDFRGSPIIPIDLP